jgi:GntR family transcriptional regulator, galactonate operon transcriptional repressor
VHPVNERRLYPERGVHNRVAHDIGRRVVSGAIAEGALLPRESELSEQFAVSRQAVREGLKVLAAKGLVYARRRVGTAVLPRNAWNLLDPDVIAWHEPADLPPDFLLQLVELRQVIEPAASEFAALRGTDEAIEAIGVALQEMRRSVDDSPAFIRADLDFHIALFVASGNVLFERLGRICEPLLGASFARQEMMHQRERIITVLIPTHAVVYDAIAAHKPALARRRMNELLLLVREEEMALRPPK